MATSTPLHAAKYPAAKTLDGPAKGAFVGKRARFNWLQIDFGAEMTDIGVVEVTKVFGYEHRIRQAEVRIGNTETATSHGLNRITSNELCDEYATYSHSLWAVFTCFVPLTGRYLTLQTMVTDFVTIDEIHVNRLTGEWLDNKLYMDLFK